MESTPPPSPDTDPETPEMANYRLRLRALPRCISDAPRYRAHLAPIFHPFHKSQNQYRTLIEKTDTDSSSGKKSHIGYLKPKTGLSPRLFCKIGNARIYHILQVLSRGLGGYGANTGYNEWTQESRVLSGLHRLCVILITYEIGFFRHYWARNDL
jgi:hypothetical protein